jgi:tRNA threonylcarbamoyladenosine biosynthesis protein TsaB
VLILGIDTSGGQGSVALLQANGGELLTLEVETVAGGQYSERLVPTIAGLLERQGAAKGSLGLIGVASGPGSFTGLRVAIAVVKGLAEAFATPVVAVSVLEAVALGSGMEGRVMAALDAQRAEVFFGEYVVDGARCAQMIRESITSFTGFVATLAGCDTQAAVCTPDEKIAARLQEAGIVAPVMARPNAEAYARIAYSKFCAGIRADTSTLDANYLRRSDAEIFSAPKLGIRPA